MGVNLPLGPNATALPLDRVLVVAVPDANITDSNWV
jgi:hypothetical protein